MGVVFISARQDFTTVLALDVSSSILEHSCQHRPRIETNSSTLSKSAVYKFRTSAVSATAYHQGSTPRLDPRPHALLNLHQQDTVAQAADDTVLYLYFV